MLQWLEERLLLKKFFTNPSVPRKSTWQYFPEFFTFLLLLLLFVSGLYLAFFYSATDVIQKNTSLKKGFWGFVYNTHAIWAKLLVFSVVLFLFRNLLTGAYQKPRELNWLTVNFLLLFIFFSFCCGSMLSGDAVAQKTYMVFIYLIEQMPFVGNLATGWKEYNVSHLNIVFILHCVAIPILIFLLMSFYLWLVSRMGIVLEKKEK